MAGPSRLEARKQRQREAALGVAMERRKRRAKLRAQLRSGEVDVMDLVAGRLDEWEDDIAGWRLDQLLDVVPGCGAVTAHEVIEAFVASPRMKVRALTYERREQLAGLLADALGRPPVR